MDGQTEGGVEGCCIYHPLSKKDSIKPSLLFSVWFSPPEYFVIMAAIDKCLCEGHKTSPSIDIIKSSDLWN